jgi:hypothetical protein
MPIVRERFGKHIPAETRLNNREAVLYVVLAATVAMQLCGKHATLTMEAVFCVARAKWL